MSRENKGSLPRTRGHSSNTDQGRERHRETTGPKQNDVNQADNLDPKHESPMGSTMGMTNGVGYQVNNAPVLPRVPSGLIRYNTRGQRIISTHHRVNGNLQWRDTTTMMYAVGPNHPKGFVWPDEWGKGPQPPKAGSHVKHLSMFDLMERRRPQRRSRSAGPYTPSDHYGSSIHGSEMENSDGYQWLPTDQSYGMTDLEVSSQDAFSTADSSHPRNANKAHSGSTTSHGRNGSTATFGNREDFQHADKERLKAYQDLRIEFQVDKDQELDKLISRAFEYGDSIDDIRKSVQRMAQVGAEAAASRAPLTVKEESGPKAKSGETRAGTAKGESKDSADSAAVSNHDGSDNL